MAYTYTQAVADFPATPSLLTGAACLGTDDSTQTSVGVTYAQLRTALFGGGTGYASNDPLNVGGNVTVAKTTPLIQLDGRGGGNSGAVIQLLGWATSSANWQIDVAAIGSGLEFTPSTSAGGATFTTPVITFSSSGSGAFSGPVYAGGQVNTENFGSQLSSNAALGTVVAAGRFSNNGAGYITRIVLSDNNTSDANITYSPNNTASLSLLGFGANSNYNVMTLSGTGIVTMSAYGAGAATFSSAGVISSVSDERRKTRIRPFRRGLKDMHGVQPISHGWDFERGTEYEKVRYPGFGARNLREHVPEVIFTHKPTGDLTMYDRGVMATMWNAILELDARTARRPKSPRIRKAA